MILKMILLPMLVKALLVTRKPALCAAIYGLALLTNSAIFDLAFGADVGRVLAILALNTAASFGFFWTLKETEDSSLYWGALIVGIGVLCFALPS